MLARSQLGIIITASLAGLLFLNALVAALFPAIAAYSQSLPFVFFSVMMLLQFILVLWFLPETKGITLERMERAISGAAAATAD